jgi:hypothetical protein
VRLDRLTSRLSIIDKAARSIPLRPNWAQRIYLDTVQSRLDAQEPIRIINLKARQLGISTITEAIIYCLAFVQPNTSGMVIANEADNSHHLLGMTNHYWETDPFRTLYRTRYQAKNTLAWHDVASSIRTTTAGNKEAGRSRTIQRLHASEVAFWLEAYTVMTGLLQAVPRLPMTFVALESTANGRGNYFHSSWNDAMAGQSEYTPLFFPWWMHYEYRASYAKIPPYDLGPLDSEEQALVALWKGGLHVGEQHYYLQETDWNDALAWRRWAIWNLLKGDIVKFHQEYPATPEEAFIATGTNVFPLMHLTKCFKQEPGQRGRLVREGDRRVKFMPDPAGPLTIFRTPNPDPDLGMYSIGGDATATVRGDYAVGQVLNRRTFEQVAIYRARIDPNHFGEELAKLGVYYNTALLAPENEGPGFATIGWLMHLDYPNMYQTTMPDGLPGRYTGKFGWSSSYRTKDLAVSWLLRYLIEGSVIIHDRHTFNEMDNYVTLDGGGYGNGAGEEHDDTVMAFCIAVAASQLEGPLPAAGSMQGTPGAVEEYTTPAEIALPWEQWDEAEERATVDAGGW